MITFTANQLRNNGSNANSKTFFQLFCLYRLMSWVTALCIRSKPRPYRRLRGGKNHFYHIHIIISRGTTGMQSISLTKVRSIDYGILQSPPIQHQTQIKNRSSYRYSGALINYRSVQNKKHEIQQTTEENNTDICALTETWMKVKNNLTQLRICPQGYKSILVPRKNRTRGGLAVVHKESINMKHNTTCNFRIIECADFTITSPSFSVHLGIIYRPPEGSVLQFSQKLADCLEKKSHHQMIC